MEGKGKKMLIIRSVIHWGARQIAQVHKFQFFTWPCNSPPSRRGWP